jgi:PhnB protein
MGTQTTIAPWLSVPDGLRALDFYVRAFGAVERYRLEDDESGHVVVAELSFDGAPFWIQEEPDARPAGGGGPVRMLVTVDDPDAAFTRAIGAGATEIGPVAEEHGWRTGRLADPFGHHWELCKRLG